MGDRQYLASLVCSGAAFLSVLACLVALCLWLGWPGALGLAGAAGALLAWFYCGPRPDLGPGGRMSPNGAGKPQSPCDEYVDH